MAEMTALEYLKQKRRMTKNCSICFDCPLSYKNNGMKLSCCDFEILFSEESISIVQKWAEEHPVKTIMQDFFEKYPEALKTSAGNPLCCAKELGYVCIDDCNKYRACYDCWNRTLEE